VKLMNCNVIRDLLPLYIDACCSADSRALIAEHLENCADCRSIHSQMCRGNKMEIAEKPEIHLHSISNWKASLLQSVMLFVSFAMLTFGVVLEGSTPLGATNGLWAIVLIVPATGYLLSLANWFFLRSYRSRRAFSNGSCLATVVMIMVGYLWARVHYGMGIIHSSPLVWCGAVLSMVLCALSRALSNQYALLLGKE